MLQLKKKILYCYLDQLAVNDSAAPIPNTQKEKSWNFLNYSNFSAATTFKARYAKIFKCWIEMLKKNDSDAWHCLENKE